MNNERWIEIWITDKTGQKWFNESVTTSKLGGAKGVVKHHQRMLSDGVCGIDKETGRIESTISEFELESIIETVVNPEPVTESDDELLAALGL